MPDIPDFTDAAWHGRRGEAKLLASILDGKGEDMPAFRRKLSEDQARELAALIRSFAPTKDKPAPERLKAPGGFEDEFRRLQKDLEELQREYRELTNTPKRSSPAEPRNDFPIRGQLPLK